MELKKPKENDKKVNLGEKNLTIVLHDFKIVIGTGSDFDQETAEKIGPQFIARLELANCKFFCFSTK